MAFPQHSLWLHLLLLLLLFLLLLWLLLPQCLWQAGKHKIYLIKMWVRERERAKERDSTVHCTRFGSNWIARSVGMSRLMRVCVCVSGYQVCVPSTMQCKFFVIKNFILLRCTTAAAAHDELKDNQHMQRRKQNAQATRNLQIRLDCEIP